MKNFLYSIWSAFLTQFGKIKVLSFSFLPILAYDPDPYYVSGYDMEEILDLIQPGDVLLRGYDKYLDGKFIPDRKKYSHAGIYVGGERNEVIHSVAPQVEYTHLLDFCQADRIMVLRPKNGWKKAKKIAESLVGTPYDFDYKTDIQKLYCFELVANCYPSFGIKTYVIRKFFGLIKRKCYLAKSFYENANFESIYEKNKYADNKRDVSFDIREI